MQVGNWTFELLRSNQGLMLKVTLHKAGAIMELVTENDLAQIGQWFSPAPKKDNGMDHNAAELIIAARASGICRRVCTPIRPTRCYVKGEE